MQDVLAAVAATPEGSDSLAAALPTYDRLAEIPTGGSQPTWLCDHVIGQQLQFLFNVIAPCSVHLQEVAN